MNTQTTPVVVFALQGIDYLNSKFTVSTPYTTSDQRVTQTLDYEVTDMPSDMPGWVALPLGDKGMYLDLLAEGGGPIHPGVLAFITSNLDPLVDLLIASLSYEHEVEQPSEQPASAVTLTVLEYDEGRDFFLVQSSVPGVSPSWVCASLLPLLIGEYGDPHELVGGCFKRHMP